MSRDIRFRAWNRYTQEMDYELYQRTLEELRGTQCLMQYTGLKDKNGVEIYEGDVVEILLNYQPHCSPVRYTEHAAAFTLESRLGRGFMLMSGEMPYEVIGNIYENPDLIGGKTDE